MINAKINHNDTVALNNAFTTGKNIAIAAGQYNVTGQLNIAYPQWVQCSGAGVGVIAGGYVPVAPVGGTVIWNRGTANNVFKISAQQASLKDCGVVQATDVIPTAGYCIVVGSGVPTNLLDSGWIERNTCYNEYQFLDVNDGVYGWDISYNNFLGGTFSVGPYVVYDNPKWAGDNKIFGNEFANEITPNAMILSIVSSDTQQWIGNKFLNCDPCVSMTSQPNSINQSFIGNSFENYGPLGAVVISGGQNIMFTGNQFGVDYGFPEFTISGSAGPGVIVGNIMTNATLGVPYTNTSNIAYRWTYVANQGRNCMHCKLADECVRALGDAAPVVQTLAIAT